MYKNLKYKILYLIIFVELFLTGYIIVRDNNIINSITLSKIIEFIIILVLIGISIFTFKYIKNRFKNNKYSYEMITTLGFLIFIIINVVRHIFLLISYWNIYDKRSIYNNALESFSGFIILTLPCIVVFAIYSICSNIVLIKKEGKRIRNILGIIIGFLAIVGLFGNQVFYFIISNFISDTPLFFIKYISNIFINATLVYLYSILLATIYCNYKAAKNTPKFDKDYVIILGCRIRKDGSLTPLLKGRVDKAIDFSKMQKEATGKDIIFIPSGGKGNDEVTSEAEAMEKYLLEQGIKKNKIIIENKSKNTYENMKFSKEIIDNNKEGKVCFSTTKYHVFRSLVTAHNLGMKCEGMGSKTKWYYNTNAVIREFLAELFNSKKKHIAMIIIIDIFAILLVLIGCHYNIVDFF